MLASVLANVNRGRGTQPFEPQDFMPVYEQGHGAPQGKRQQTQQEQQAIFRLFAQMTEQAN